METPKEIIGWRAYYADGKVYTDFPLPPAGLVCVMEYEARDWAPGKPYRRIVKGGDWYWFDGDRWQRVKTGEWETWQDKPNAQAIQSTTRLPEAEYNRIVESAFAAEAWP